MRKLAELAGQAVSLRTIQEVVEASRAKGTMVAYRRWNLAYRGWARTGARLAPDRDECRNLFLCHLWNQGKMKSIRIAHSALVFYYGSLSSRGQEVAKLICEAAARSAAPVVHRPKLSEEQLWTLVEGLGTTRADRRMSAFLVLGFYAMMRVSELTRLGAGDLQFSRTSMTVRIRKSKTDQLAVGVVIKLDWGEEHKGRDVIQTWVKLNEVDRMCEKEGERVRVEVKWWRKAMRFN